MWIFLLFGLVIFLGVGLAVELLLWVMRRIGGAPVSYLFVATFVRVLAYTPCWVDIKEAGIISPLLLVVLSAAIKGTPPQLYGWVFSALWSCGLLFLFLSRRWATFLGRDSE